jgi:hypothetical protein
MPIEHNMWSGMPGDTWEDHQKREQEMIEDAERKAREAVEKVMREIEEKERKEKEDND